MGVWSPVAADLGSHHLGHPYAPTDPVPARRDRCSVNNSIPSAEERMALYMLSESSAMKLQPDSFFLCYVTESQAVAQASFELTVYLSKALNLQFFYK